MAGEGAVTAHGSAEHLVQMANDIGNFFRSEPSARKPIAGIANHIAKFWTPRMRQKLLAHVKEHGDAGSTSCRARRSSCSPRIPPRRGRTSRRAATPASEARNAAPARVQCAASAFTCATALRPRAERL